MELDLSSYFSASLALTLLLLVAEIIMHKTAFVLKFGIVGLYIFITVRSHWKTPLIRQTISL